MGIKERKKRDEKRMRERILKAAREIFAEGGYKHVTMRRIARKIEYSPGTIYRYFKDKNEIMLQLCYQGFEQLLAMQLKLDRVADPLDRLVTGARYYISFAVENPDFYELMFATEEIIKQPDEGEESVALSSFLKLVDHVQACIDNGDFSGEDAETLAISVWSALHGMSLLLIKQQLSFLPEEKLDAIVEKALAFNLRGEKSIRVQGPQV